MVSRRETVVVGVWELTIRGLGDFEEKREETGRGERGVFIRHIAEAGEFPTTLSHDALRHRSHSPHCAK